MDNFYEYNPRPQREEPSSFEIYPEGGESPPGPPSGSLKVVICKDGVLYHATVSGTLGEEVTAE